MRISDWSSDVCSSDLRGRLKRSLVLRRLFRCFVIFRVQDVDFGLQRLAARLLLIVLRLIGGFDLLRRGTEGVRARGGDTDVGDADTLRLRESGGRHYGRNRQRGDRQRGSGKDFLHQNWVPTLNEKRLVSSPSSLRRA